MQNLPLALVQVVKYGKFRTIELSKKKPTQLSGEKEENLQKKP